MKLSRISSLLCLALFRAATAIPVNTAAYNANATSTVPTTQADIDAIFQDMDIWDANRQSQNYAVAVRLEFEGFNSFCQTIDRVVRTNWNQPGYVRFVGYIMTGSGLAGAICDFTGHTNCGFLVAIIQGSLMLAYRAAAGYAGATAAELPLRKRDGDNDAVAAEYRQWWEDTMEKNPGVSYRSIGVFPFDPAKAFLAKRDVNEPDLVARVHISGLQTRGLGASGTDNVTHDVAASLFMDGTTVLHVRLPDELEHEMAKRNVKTPAFKVAFTTRQQSLLSEIHKENMALAIAQAYASLADHTLMSQMMGFLKTEHKANFYYRIIAETRSFDLKYESVDKCGGMAGFL